MKNLSNNLGKMEYDGLITDIIPQVQVRGGTVAALTTATTYKRGTVLAKSTKDGKLYILGSTAATGDTLTADCILCDDTEIGTTDTKVEVYTAGCFGLDKLTVTADYTITEADKDKLRERGIVFKSASEAE